MADTKVDAMVDAMVSTMVDRMVYAMVDTMVDTKVGTKIDILALRVTRSSPICSAPSHPIVAPPLFQANPIYSVHSGNLRE